MATKIEMETLADEFEEGYPVYTHVTALRKLFTWKSGILLQIGVANSEVLIVEGDTPIFLGKLAVLPNAWLNKFCRCCRGAD